MRINNNQNWALSLQKEDPTLQERIRNQMEHIKKSKNTLMNSAEQYSTKYQSEVVEGTKKLQRLLEDGRRKGKTDQEILDGQTVFCPSVRTPILNMLYFLLREHPDAHKIDLNRLQEDKIQFGHPKFLDLFFLFYVHLQAVFVIFLFLQQPQIDIL
jgi:hypothetical protein